MQFKIMSNSKAKHSPIRSDFNHCLLVLRLPSLLLLLILQACTHLAALSQSTIKFLPGFQGPLPFHLETGYVGVDESEDVQLFYYFIKSESNPEEDPLLLWLTGGPGCSSFSGLIYEVGPLKFEETVYNGSLPQLIYDPYTWTKAASIIFVDLPVGTGFSYAKTPNASESDDIKASEHAYEFLRKWLANHHPEFISNPFYLSGNSYSGITLPIIAQTISNGNEAGIQPLINLKGYLLGNPGTFPAEDNFAVPFAHGMGIISDELYESLQKNCNGDYQNIDPNNSQCLLDVQAFEQFRNEINTANILEPNCGVDAPKPHKLSGRRRFLNGKFQELYNPQLSLSAFKCRVEGYWLSYYWSNNDIVQEALHVRKGTIKKWVRCNHNLRYTKSVTDSLPYHLNLSTKGFQSLIYSGDHDMVVTFLSTQAWIRSLNYSIVDDWRSWLVHGQVAGYTRTYSNRMTFATVKGGGHTAPEYKPLECLAMFKRWLSHQPL